MKQIVFIGLIGFCLGIYIGEYRNISMYLAMLLLCVTLGCIFLKHTTLSFNTRSTHTVFIILCAVSFGVFRTEYAYVQLPDFVFSNNIETKQQVQVEVVSPIDVRENSARFIAKPIPEASSTSAISIPYIRVTLPRVHDVEYGDVLLLSGTLVPLTTNNKTYVRAYEALERKGILYEMRLPEITEIAQDKGNYFYTAIYNFGDAIKHTIHTYIREPSAGFINGILLGEKHGLSNEWYTKFRDIGLTHVIVLSGYNLAIVFAWTRIALRRAPFVVQHVSAACAVIALTLISGAEAPAVRAAILVLTASLAAMLRRQEDAGYFLALTISAMLMWNPFYLLYDISFQLSVAATYGLTYLAPTLEKYIFQKPQYVRELVRDTLSAQIAVLPLQLLYFGTLSWVSLFANIAILPFIPLLMILGVLVAVTSFVPFVASSIGTLTTIVSDAVLRLVTFFASHTDIIALSISPLTFLLMHVGMIFFIMKARTKI